jgi:hypothetical protein
MAGETTEQEASESGTATSPPPPPAPPPPRCPPQQGDRPPRRSRDPRVFVLERELAEVHLLLDNVSANPHTTVAERTVETGTEDELPRDWIEKICDITWPPQSTDEDRAEDAALLIRAKDHLNRLSYPASGATIAFTTLVTQCDLRLRSEEAKAPAEAGASPVPAAEAPPGGEAAPAPADPACPPSESPTRRSLAETAYPDLVVRARSFATWMWWISMVLLAVLILTCGFSWYVAYGNAALAELTAATQRVDAAQQRVNQAESSADKPVPPPNGSAAPAPNASPPPPAPPPKRFVGYCERLIITAEQKQACDARAVAFTDRQRVEHRLAAWTFGIWKGDPSGPASLANILGSAVLPFFYGLLGAAAAVVRSLSRKIRSSLLSPRDLPLSLQQLALGAVMGACIGLFIAAPGDAGKGESLLAPTGLSGPAISFIAGFGVEAVFQALEELIRRIFNVAPIAAVEPLSVPSRTVIVRSTTVKDASAAGEDGDAGKLLEP